jgi:CDP-L-myo-inositol myo-inositolphosphotransferase
MRAVLLAAGLATRMGDLAGEKPKGLLKICNRELVYRTIEFLKKRGVNDFIVVVNEKSKKAYEKFFSKLNVNYTIVVNESPERGNGYSLLKAKNFVKGKFVLFMSDHVYEEEFIEKALKGFGIIVDKVGRFIEKDEATKVKISNGKVADIGKNLKDYDGYDTGFFVLNEEIFKSAQELHKEKESFSLSEVVKRSRLPVYEVSGLFWMDVDTPEDLRRARKLILKLSVKEGEDGIVAQKLNRKVSTFLSTLLSEKLTPNKATFISFLVGILSTLTAIVSLPVGGALYQLSSMIDGMDGELARCGLRTTKLGGYIDSILDRFVDSLFLLAVAVHVKPSLLSLLLLGSAIFGSTMVSYTTEKYKASFSSSPFKDIPELKKFPGKRDERVFLIFLTSLTNSAFLVLLLVALLSNLKVLYNVYSIVKKHNKGGKRCLR